MANKKTNEPLHEKLIREHLDKVMPGWQEGTSWDKVMALREARKKAREAGTYKEAGPLPLMKAGPHQETSHKSFEGELFGILVKRNAEGSGVSESYVSVPGNQSAGKNYKSVHRHGYVIACITIVVLAMFFGGSSVAYGMLQRDDMRIVRHPMSQREYLLAKSRLAEAKYMKTQSLWRQWIYQIECSTKGIGRVMNMIWGLDMDKVEKNNEVYFRKLEAAERQHIADSVRKAQSIQRPAPPARQR